MKKIIILILVLLTIISGVAAIETKISSDELRYSNDDSRSGDGNINFIDWLVGLFTAGRETYTVYCGWEYGGDKGCEAATYGCDGNYDSWYSVTEYQTLDQCEQGMGISDTAPPSNDDDDDDDDEWYHYDCSSSGYVTSTNHPGFTPFTCEFGCYNDNMESLNLYSIDSVKGSMCMEEELDEYVYTCADGVIKGEYTDSWSTTTNCESNNCKASYWKTSTQRTKSVAEEEMCVPYIGPSTPPSNDDDEEPCSVNLVYDSCIEFGCYWDSTSRMDTNKCKESSDTYSYYHCINLGVDEGLCNNMKGCSWYNNQCSQSCSGLSWLDCVRSTNNCEWPWGGPCKEKDGASSGGGSSVTKCSDGTPINTCSKTSSVGKPFYCDASGNFKTMSSVCGCPSGQEPVAGGACQKIEKTCADYMVPLTSWKADCISDENCRFYDKGVYNPYALFFADTCIPKEDCVTITTDMLECNKYSGCEWQNGRCAEIGTVGDCTTEIVSKYCEGNTLMKLETRADCETNPYEIRECSSYQRCVENDDDASCIACEQWGRKCETDNDCCYADNEAMVCVYDANKGFNRCKKPSELGDGGNNGGGCTSGDSYYDECRLCYCENGNFICPALPCEDCGGEWVEGVCKEDYGGSEDLYTGVYIQSLLIDQSQVQPGEQITGTITLKNNRDNKVTVMPEVWVKPYLQEGVEVLDAKGCCNNENFASGSVVLPASSTKSYSFSITAPYKGLEDNCGSGESFWAGTNTNYVVKSQIYTGCYYSSNSDWQLIGTEKSRLITVKEKEDGKKECTINSDCADKTNYPFMKCSTYGQCVPYPHCVNDKSCDNKKGEPMDCPDCADPCGDKDGNCYDDCTGEKIPDCNSKKPVDCSTLQELPVCGEKDDTKKTYRNTCEMGSDGAKYVSTGKCPFKPDNWMWVAGVVGVIILLFLLLKE